MTVVDTNVLLYAVSGVAEEAPKRRIAEELLLREDLAFSVQVFQEFCYQATHSKRRGKGALVLSREDAQEFLALFCESPVLQMDLSVIRIAWEIEQEYGTSYWDAAILAAANLMGCDAVLSEDLNAGQVYGRVRVVNPFAGLR